MKYRQGFVSNSSSSSFLIYGVCVERDELAARLIEGPWTEAVLAKANASLAWSRQSQAEYAAKAAADPSFKYYSYEVREDYASFAEYFVEEDNKWDAIYSLAGEIDGKSECPFEDGTTYFGISWDKVGDDETGRQFKARVEQILKDMFGEGLECGTFEEAWRNG